MKICTHFEFIEPFFIFFKGARLQSFESLVLVKGMGKRQSCPRTSHKEIYGEVSNSYIRS